MSERIFYDGDCGVCHWGVKWVASHDHAEPGGEGRGPVFRFAPLGGSKFAGIRSRAPSTIPDSIAVETASGEILWRSDGVIYILRRLGGRWRILAGMLSRIPRSLRDWGYDLFARLRHRLAPRPEGTCPLVPPELARRFDP